MSVLSTLSRIINVLARGSWQQTFCARAMESYLHGRFPGDWFWGAWVGTLNRVIFLIWREPNHCYEQLLRFPAPGNCATGCTAIDNPITCHLQMSEPPHVADSDPHDRSPPLRHG